jgi:hypothetical protein
LCNLCKLSIIRKLNVSHILVQNFRAIFFHPDNLKLVLFLPNFQLVVFLHHFETEDKKGGRQIEIWYLKKNLGSSTLTVKSKPLFPSYRSTQLGSSLLLLVHVSCCTPWLCPSAHPTLTRSVSLKMEMGNFSHGILSQVNFRPATIDSKPDKVNWAKK